MFVEWVLVNNRLAFTSCPAEEKVTGPTSDPEPSHPPPTPCMERMPEPIADTESAMMAAPYETKTEPIIIPELEPYGMYDQVIQPATPSVTVGVLVV